MQTPHEMPRNMRIYLHQLQPCLVVTAKPCERLRCPSRRLSGGLQAVCTRHLGRVSLSAADKRCNQWRGPHQRAKSGAVLRQLQQWGEAAPKARPGQARSIPLRAGFGPAALTLPFDRESLNSQPRSPPTILPTGPESFAPRAASLHRRRPCRGLCDAHPRASPAWRASTQMSTRTCPAATGTTTLSTLVRRVRKAPSARVADCFA